MYYKKNQALKAAQRVHLNAKEETKVIVEHDYSQNLYFIHVLPQGESQRHICGTIVKTLTK